MAKPVRLNLGCGTQYWPGFINVDLHYGDILADFTQWEGLEEKADEIQAIHVFEHLKRNTVYEVLMRWRAMLKEGGKIVLEMPCLDSIIRLLIAEQTELAMGGVYGDETQGPDMRHEWCYSVKEITQLMQQAGFKEVQVVEPKFHVISRDMRVEAIA